MTTLLRRHFLAQASAAALALATARLPGFAQRTPSPWLFNVLDFGAKGDGVTNDATAIQAAIEACAAQRGGTVLLPAGCVFLSGTLVLKSFVTLEIQSGAVLKASPDRDKFRKLGSLLFALDAQSVTVRGGGVIDGNFPAFLKERTAQGYNVLEPFLGPYDPLYDKPGKDHDTGRPRVILLVGCKGVRLEEFTIRDSPTWTIHTIGCENLLVSRVTIRNSLEVPNCDGIDVDHCRNVRIENCDFIAGDDCICLKASRNFMEYGDCENIVVANSIFQSSSSGLKVEAEGSAAIRMATFTGCVIVKSNRGIAINNRDGGLVEDLLFADIKITTDLRPSMWWGAGEPIYVTNMPRNLQMQPSWVRNIRFSNISAVGESGAYLYGWPGQELENITLDNVDLTLEHKSPLRGGYYDLRPGDLDVAKVFPHAIAGVYAERVNGLALQNVAVHWRPPTQDYYGVSLELHHVRGLNLEDVTGRQGRISLAPSVSAAQEAKRAAISPAQTDASPDQIMDDLTTRF
jgi:hypothetical protein